jgi:hypothetical protein
MYIYIISHPKKEKRKFARTIEHNLNLNRKKGEEEEKGKQKGKRKKKREEVYKGKQNRGGRVRRKRREGE